jgi:hypothetical protein
VGLSLKAGQKKTTSEGFGKLPSSFDQHVNAKSELQSKKKQAPQLKDKKQAQSSETRTHQWNPLGYKMWTSCFISGC